MIEQSPVEAIFFAALEKGTPTERAAYLDSACGEDQELRKRVERLLSAHPQVGSFLEVAATSDISACHSESGGVAGTVIGGRYKLIEQIGEGGMGAVWMAQQTEPVKRMVAVKLIKSGMDSKSVLARFEAERQALALMDHPNIAKVLDAGATDDGRPFFVMELVKGMPITRYCDERKLPLRQRLDLFISVCQAVQHAHQKGVIHRDLKPSNVLVAQYDDQPAPKVIDFGIAKAAGQPLTDLTLVTGFGAIVGTPEYMSPEQAKLNQLDIDTRSDIYALGVLLYELLTGSTPVTRHELEKAGLLEVLRMIREQEPPRPSTRLSSSATLPEIAASRSSEPHVLAGLVRNDLDWIVMKSLEKDRNRRYETANGFAADIRRYLDGDAVQAHPPTTHYLLRKFFHKHRVGISTALAFVLLLVVAVGISTILALQARKSAFDANYHLGLAEAAKIGLAEALEEANLTTASLQIDSDLAENIEDRRVTLLRLVRRLKELNPPISNMVFNDDLIQRRRSLSEFTTMAVLANGQEYAPLLPSITHDGLPISQMHISSDYRTMMTLGTDSTVRLWDMRTGKCQGFIRKANEGVVNVGFSPDGKVAFTDDSTGITRLWDVDSGKYLCEIPRRDNLYPIPVGNAPHWLYAGESMKHQKYKDRSACVSIGESRLLTQHVVVKPRSKDEKEEPQTEHMFAGPIELWDTKTGKLVTRLDQPGQRIQQFRWINSGKWITTRSGLNKLLVLSGKDGQTIAELQVPGNEEIYFRSLQLSPDGHRIAVITNNNQHKRVRLWSTQNWKERISENVNYIDNTILLWREEDDIFRLWNNEVFSASGGFGVWEYIHYLFKFGNDKPIAQSQGWSIPKVGNQDLLISTDGRVFDTIEGSQRISSLGKRFDDSIYKRPFDDRFLVTSSEQDAYFWVKKGKPFRLIDFKTDKWITVFNEIERDSPFGQLPNLGLANVRYDYGLQIQMLPTLVKDLKVSPDLIELWVNVAVRGELGLDGKFIKWNEPTWEEKRQELAEMPSPCPDFPFPSHVAKDRLHWLRQEFQGASESAKPMLAKQLLERCQASGDNIEAIRWQNWFATNIRPEAVPASQAKP